MMTRDDQRLRTLLEEERSRLMADLEYFSKLEYAHEGVGNHMADEGTAAFDQASDLALRNQTEHHLKRVEHALAKLDAGAFGYCENCGDPIDFARLKALPDARFCLKCQRQRETPGSGSLGPRAYESGEQGATGK